MTNCPKCGTESSVVNGECLAMDCEYTWEEEFAKERKYIYELDDGKGERNVVGSGKDCSTCGHRFCD